MTPADVTKAQRLAREWMEKHGKEKRQNLKVKTLGMSRLLLKS